MSLRIFSMLPTVRALIVYVEFFYIAFNLMICKNIKIENLYNLVHRYTYFQYYHYWFVYFMPGRIQVAIVFKWP